VALRGTEVLALSNYTASALRAHEPGVRQTTMPMPVDPAVFHPAGEASDLRRRVGFAGRFADPRKNITLLFDALAVCRDRGFDVTCALVGDSPTPEFIEYLRERGLSEAVAFLGFRDRGSLRDYYDTLDLLIISSHQEGLGIVGLEAMACGCPVVATRCGGTEDYVKDGVNGYLVGFSAAEMADAIMRILSDAPLRQSLRAGALETIRRDYSEVSVERVFWQRFDAVFGQASTQ
jgi:glycosyltransferase involved in cell wall biosynthesis